MFSSFSPLLFSNSFTFSARPSSVFFNTGIFWCVLMAMRAMCFSLVSFAFGFSTKCKARNISLMIWVKNFFNIPSKINSLVNCLMRYTSIFRPFHSSLSFSIKFYKSIASSVAHLLRSSRPSAVFRGVTFISINPIKSHSLWRMPHILYKKLNTIFPSVANSYSSFAIIFKSSIIRVKTSLLHLMVNRLNFSAAQAMPCLSNFFHVKSFRVLVVSTANVPHNRYGVNLAL